MKLFHIRAACGLSLAVLLAACGAGNPADLPPQTAAMVPTGAMVQTAAMVQTNSQPGIQAGTPARGATRVAAANMPAPDCAADGCKGLRIIDANAEAFRYEAMRRAAVPQS